MAALHRQLSRLLLHRAVEGAAAPAAILHWIVAAAFLFLTAIQLVDPLDAGPGRELIDRWWLLEAIAIWSVPVAWFLFRIPGARSLLLQAIPPLLALLAVAALSIGVCARSSGILCGGVALVFLLSKCVSLRHSSACRGARELFAVRVLVGVLAGALSVVAVGVVLVAIREVFDPAALRGAGVARAALLLAGVFYFATLAVLEVVLVDPRAARGARA